MMNFGEPWTSEEDALIRASYGKVTREILSSSLPRRTWAAVRERARKLGANGISRPGLNCFELRGNEAVIFLDRRDGSRLECRISVDDLDRVLAAGKWRAHDAGNGIYARTKNLYLHRFLTDCPAHLDTDHRDGDTLNNTRGNLRVATRSGNNQNRPALSQNSASGRKNIYWHKTLRLWVVKLRVDGVGTVKYAKTFDAAVVLAAKLRNQLHPYAER